MNPFEIDEEELKRRLDEVFGDNLQFLASTHTISETRKLLQDFVINELTEGNVVLYLPQLSFEGRQYGPYTMRILKGRE